MRLIRLLLFVCFVSVLASSASAATLRVCASGCQYTSLQAAIDAAQPGDTILLRAGETFVGPFYLRKKAATTQWITIRSDAADSLLPAAGVRLVPEGKLGANTPRALLPRLIGQSGAYKTTPALRTDPGAHHYILKFLDIDGSANLGFETVLNLGHDTSTAPSTDIIVDRVYVHGHPYKGNKRGITLNGVRIDILNSYISDIKAVNADSQAIAGWNGAGPFKIINNYLEGAGENVLFGGSDPAVTNLVPSNIEIRRNHLFKPLAWQKPILATPASPRATASATTGVLAGGTHYFRVVALMYTDNATAVSVPSTVVSASVTAGKSVTVSWSSVRGADRYRIYRGTSATSQSRYLETPAAGTSFTYTGSAEKSGTPPSAGTKWVVKNAFELKNAQYVVFDGNVIDNVWPAGQYGYAIVLTPRNQYGGAPWVRVRDVTITNNLVRHVAGILQITGYDANSVTQQTQRVTLRNNLFMDVDPSGSSNAKAYLVGEAVANLVIDRNTLIHKNSSIVYAYGSQTMSGFVYTNNISLHNTYGIMGAGGRTGLYTINMYFPASVIKYNVFAGGPASSYPTPNAFPTVTQWNASFVDFAGADYRLLQTSPFYTAGVNGSVPGANLGALNAALAGVSTSTPTPDPQPTPDPPPPSTNTPPIARPGGPYSGATGASITVDGSASSDTEGNIASYRWTWGDEILINAANVPASSIVGSRWARVQTSGAAGGWALHNANKGEAKKSAALAAPGSYVDVRFYAAAGVPYRLWFRMRAEADNYANDSMFVQFSDSVDAQGNSDNRIGTTDAAIVILEEGEAKGVAGWGWNDAHYGALAPPVYFARSGVQTMRVQQREDGIMWDQVVLSARTYLTSRPGLTRSDDTTLSATFGTTSGVVASHAYPVAGAYPLVLTVVDGQGAAASAATTVNVGATTQSLVTARAGGPYTGTVGVELGVDGSTSTVPSSATAKYLWSFGDDIVLRSSSFKTLKGRWRTVSLSSAAGGTALENTNGEAKISTALSAPSNYVEATFRAAAGVPYRLWLRMRALNDSYENDSVHVQFSGSVTSTGAATTRIGSTSAHAVLLEEGKGAGVSGWGWADASYGGLASPIYFNADGTQTIRIQQREDGVQIDQVIISAGEHFADAPGLKRGDTTIVPLFGADATGAATGHVYRRAGVFPITLTVDAGAAGTATSTTTATVK